MALSFGKRIQQLRKERGLTQQQLADALGVTKGTVSVWERDGRKPEFETLDNLCSLLNVTMAYLYDENAAETPTQLSDEETVDVVLSEEAMALENTGVLLAQLSEHSLGIVKATIAAAYKQDKECGMLQELQFNISVKPLRRSNR